MPFPDTASGPQPRQLENCAASTRPGPAELPPAGAGESAAMTMSPGLYGLARLAREMGVESLAAEAEDLALRRAEGRVYLACLGQFKRGKSTLINALLGEPVLPAGTLPVTALATVVRYGPQPQLRIRSQQGEWETAPLAQLPEYVSQAANPENRRGISAVEVLFPAPILAGGLCLVDTPGPGSIFAGNTRELRDFLPRLDAALLVFGADPPLTGEELELAAAAASHTREWILVLNKADRATPEETAAAAAFAREKLEARLQRRLPPVWMISAGEQLAGAPAPQRDWLRLWRQLRLLSQNPELARQSARRGFQRIRRELQALLQAEREALRLPLAESRRRLAELEKTAAAIEQSLRELEPLLDAEQKRMAAVWAARQRDFLRQAGPQADARLAAALAGRARLRGPRLRRALMAEAQSIARALVQPWLASEAETADRELNQLNRHWLQLAARHFAALARSGVAGLAPSEESLAAAPGLAGRSRFIFHEQMEIAAPASPLLWLADSLRGALRVRGGIEADAREFLRQLLAINASRALHDLRERAHSGRRDLARALRQRLHEGWCLARQTYTHARGAQAAGEPALAAALARLDRLEQALQALETPAP